MSGQISDTGQSIDTGESADVAAEAHVTRKRKRVRLEPLKQLIPYLIANKSMLILGGIALLIAAATTLMVPIAVRRIIDHGFVSTNDSLINNYFLMLMVMGTVLAIFSSMRAYCVNWLGERVVADLRADVFRHLTTLGPSFFATTHSGEVMSRLTADTTQIKAAAGNSISQALRNAIMLIGAVIMMFVTSVQLSLIILLAIPAIVLPLIAYGRVIRRLSRTAQDELAASSAYAAENLAAIMTLQSYTNEGPVTSRFRSTVEDAFQAAAMRLRARAGLTCMAILLITLSIVGVLWYGSSLVVDNNISAGRLGQFVLYAVFAASALAQLAEVMGEVQQAAGAAERLAELLSVSPMIKSPPNPVAFPKTISEGISFRDVSFAYPNRCDAPALRNVSFTADAGEMVALVGPSGAGKSTVLNLLLRFYDPDKGRIRIGGIDISRMDLHDLRRHIAVVSQEIALFADTVRENIRYGAPGASDAQIERAAKAAQAERFLLDLDHGYDTVLGERGIQLSGGQRQRIAIARAILRDAPILLLDEATSALDAENEGLLQAALEEVMRGRTTIVVAHRLATIQKADRILVMDNGRIVEVGSHQSLITQGGLYARLADLQFAAA